MTEPQQSQNVITGPEIHPAGTHAETVRWRLPYGGGLVVRVEQDKRDPSRFRAMTAPGEVAAGSRDDVLAAIEAHARHLGEREVRRRDGSIDPADHIAPPGNVPWPDLWAHMYDVCYRAYCRAHPGARGLPDAALAAMRGLNAAEAGRHEQGYREFVRGWAEIERHRRYLADADAHWQRTR